MATYEELGNWLGDTLAEQHLDQVEFAAMACSAWGRDSTPAALATFRPSRSSMERARRTAGERAVTTGACQIPANR